MPDPLFGLPYLLANVENPPPPPPPDGGGGGGGGAGGGGGGAGGGGGNNDPIPGVGGFPVKVKNTGSHWRFETDRGRVLDIYPPEGSTIDNYSGDAFCLSYGHSKGFGVPYSGSGDVTGYCLYDNETVIKVYEVPN